jgi:hypothetical protein
MDWFPEKSIIVVVGVAILFIKGPEYCRSRRGGGADGDLTCRAGDVGQVVAGAFGNAASAVTFAKRTDRFANDASPVADWPCKWLAVRKRYFR